jgi:hypothetical protein
MIGVRRRTTDLRRRIVWPRGGGRPALSAALAIALCGVTFASRPASAAGADPPAESVRQEYLDGLAAAAQAALAAEVDVLDAAVRFGRRGTARTIAGDRAPGPPLRHAAAALGAGMPHAENATRAVAALSGAMIAIEPGLPPIPVPPGPDELASIAAQLRETAAAAGPFVRRRLTAEGTLEALGTALAALDHDHPAAALRGLRDARHRRAVLARWDPAPPTLSFWLNTVGKLIGAAERIADATIAGDASAARRAVADYRRASAEAQRADFALAIAIGEAGAALAQAALERLARAVGTTTDASAAVASVLHP